MHLLHMSRSPGTKGTIKKEAEDFIVKEITSKGFVLEKDTRYKAQDIGEEESSASRFTVFVLQKRGWNTIQALAAIAKKVSRGKKSISYAGVKDRRAITVQLASIYGASPEAVANVHIKDISINGAWPGGKVELGSNIGNSFEVKIADCENPENIGDVMEELNGMMPNFFGEQRFGMRSNNHKIGMHLLRNELEDAALEFLTSTENETEESAKEARKELKQSMDFSRALGNFPKYLVPERLMLAHLANTKYDFAGALRKIPRGILIMFVHAAQAQIFNEELARRIKNSDFESDLRCAENFYGFPDPDRVSREGKYPLASIIGYDSEHINEYEKALLEEMQIGKESFKIKSMPELSMKGTYRPLLVNFKKEQHKIQGNNVLVRFELPSGSYASVLLGEVIK
ncbi:MAG: tRNA pseudouridine(13) synthase TruD [Candidatus Micrarchaeaceae archaeon]